MAYKTLLFAKNSNFLGDNREKAYFCIQQLTETRNSSMIYNDRRVLTVLLIAGIFIMGLLFILGDNTQTAAHQPRQDTYGQMQEKTLRKERRQPYYRTDERKPETFTFDPNTADSTQLLRLGLRPWQVRSIYRYRARGGIYKKKEDFANLYGLTVKDYRRLEPYIHISPDYRPAAALIASRRDTVRPQRDTATWPRKIAEEQRIVLNTADEATLRKVPGIGFYFAQEILRHGRWLGGYVDVNQLDDITDFPQEAKKYFVIHGAAPQKLMINKLSLSALRRHPYLNFYQAKAILDYRRMYGKIQSLQDLSLLPAFNETDLKRLEPYVEF